MELYVLIGQQMKITAVITSRNDNYGGHLAHRAHLALTNFLHRYDEVIYVDWNSESQSLIEEIRHKLPKTGKLKHILVTPEDVISINPTLATVQIVEVLGRNVGIRLAQGDYIVSTNIDIVAQRPNLDWLDQNTVYTTPRRDISVAEFLSATDAIEWGDYLIDNYTSYEKKPDANRPEDINDPWSLVVCCGDYQLAHRSLWWKMRGFEESMIYRNFADTNLMKKGAIYGNISKLDLPIFHLNHSGHGDGTGGVSVSNEKDKYVSNFSRTENAEDWGLVGVKLKIEVI
jgi:hypothetical protein